jgi:sugar-specific transcriptional regulator TrmB
METEALVETLEEAGLSPYQASAYVALLEFGTAPVTTLADASGVPGPRIYDVVDALSERGYVESYEQETVKARAHDSAAMVDDLRARADRLESAADEIEDRWEQPTLDRMQTSTVTRFQTVVDRARLFVEEAETRVHVSVTPDHLDQLRDALTDAHERGVAVHVLVHTAPGVDPPASDTVAGLCREARHRGLQTPFVALVDRRRACFSHPPHVSDRYGVLVDDPVHTFVFHWYFMTCLWDHARPLYSDRGRTPPFEYVDLRQFVRDVEPLLDDSASVAVRVEGTDLETGDDRTVAGTVAAVRSARSTSEEIPHVSVAGQVTLVVETDEGRVRVGGWNAVVEDMEATRVLVEDVSGATDDALRGLVGRGR